ncbi:hypothetical protein KKD52_09895 [Myxococcota bacterium]|nr:hypothetical protein [Myxococcota bacterium]MBU1410819.1 hypothetical protein [Myxococcota bacterium]MBU1510659.1 hypothetical protein [Myxococcota bacterium]
MKDRRKPAALLGLLFILGCSEPPQQHRGPSDPRESTVRPIVPDHRMARKSAAIRNPDTFPWYVGPEVIPSFKPGDRVWTPTPIGRSWDIINMAIASVVRIDGNHVVLQAGVLEFTVPAAVLLPAVAPARLAPRTPVLACLGLTGEWGRVTTASQETVNVQLVMAQSVITREVDTASVLALTGKGGPGHPVTFHRGENIGFGLLLYLNREKAGIITYTGKLELVAPDQVRFVPLNVIPVKNATMWSPFADSLEEVRILQVLENGAAVEILFVSRPQEPLINPRIVTSARVTKMLW